MSVLDNIPSDFVPITPDDDNDIPSGVPLWLWTAGCSGNIQVTTLEGTICVIPINGVAMLPLKVRRVWSSNTTPGSVILAAYL